MLIFFCLRMCVCIHSTALSFFLLRQLQSKYRALAKVPVLVWKYPISQECYRKTYFSYMQIHLIKLGRKNHLMWTLLLFYDILKVYVDICAFFFISSICWSYCNFLGNFIMAAKSILNDFQVQCLTSIRKKKFIRKIQSDPSKYEKL